MNVLSESTLYLIKPLFSVKKRTDSMFYFCADFLPRACIILVVWWCGTSGAPDTCGRFSRLVDACRLELFQSVVVASVFHSFHSECKYFHSQAKILWSTETIDYCGVHCCEQNFVTALIKLKLNTSILLCYMKNFGTLIFCKCWWL